MKVGRFGVYAVAGVIHTVGKLMVRVLIRI